MKRKTEESSGNIDYGRTRTISRFLLIILVLIGGALILAACGRGDDEATETAVPPTGTSPEEASNAWERVQSTGRLVIGTAADYPPFEYYTEEFQLDGMDIVLISEIAQKLGVTPEFKDMAFEGLGGAVQLGQVDVAIAALSVTDEREAKVDFSNVYFVSIDAALARADASLDQLQNVEELAAMRVAVQRDTVYDNWLQENLVDTGLMPQENLLEYDKIENAIRDLKENRNDIVVLDLQPAEIAVSEGGVKIVGQGLNLQRFAIALAQGEKELQEQINNALTELQNSGRLTEIVAEYTNIKPEQIPPLPTPAPEKPTPAPTPEGCIDGMAFIQDLNLDDNNMKNPPKMPPGVPFQKGWRIQNSGTCEWNSGYKLVYVSGNTPLARMGGEPTAVQGIVPAGKQYDMWVDQVSPLYAGTYQGFWQMVNDKNRPFGERIWVGIEVVGPPTATPAATQTPSSGMAFTVNSTNITAGQCVVFNWAVQGAQNTYFYPLGSNWPDYPVPPVSSATECPTATTTYELRAAYSNGTSELRQIQIFVKPDTAAPQITRFTIDPPGQAALGQSIKIVWQVEGNVTNVQLLRNDTVLWNGAPHAGSFSDIPPSTGTVAYKLVAAGPGGTSNAQHNITVVNMTPPTATPIPPTPQPDPPVILSFSVQPTSIISGACVHIQWAAGGGVTKVELKRDSQTILDNAPFSGSAQDCPHDPGSYVYRLITYGQNNTQDSRDITVTVASASGDLPLQNSTWNVTNYWNGSQLANLIPGSSIWIKFSSGGTFSGNSACNNYNGSYSQSGAQLTISNLVNTGQQCADPSIMDQEKAYYSALESSASFTINKNQLAINNGSGQTVLNYSGKP